MTNILGSIGLKIILVLAIFFAGWTVNGWKKDKEIVQMKLASSQAQVLQLEEASTKLNKASEDMQAAAEDVQNKRGINDAKLDKIAKEIGKLRPLPADCKPTPDRVLNLRKAIELTNNSIAR